MDLISLLVVLVVIGAAMYLVYAYVQPQPLKWIFEAVLAIVLIIVVLRVAGVDLGGVDTR
jgi:uncharacterized membrane-anchored protein